MFLRGAEESVFEELLEVKHRPQEWKDRPTEWEKAGENNVVDCMFTSGAYAGCISGTSGGYRSGWVWFFVKCVRSCAFRKLLESNKIYMRGFRFFEQQQLK